MKPRDAVLEAFRLGVPDRIPVALFGGGAWTIFNSDNTFLTLAESPQKMADVLISMSSKLRSDIVYCGSGYNNFHAAALGGEMKFRKVGPPDLAAPLVNSLKELDKLDLEDLAGDKIVNTIWDATRIVSEEIGGEYLVTATCWGPFTLGAQIMGVENLMISIFRDPGFVKKVVDFAARLNLEFYRPLIEESVIEVVSIADPTASGDLISKKHFDEFALPYLRRINREFKKKGVYSLVHICGDTTDKLASILECGATCFTLDYKVDLKAAKELFKGKMCIAGNVDPVGVMNEKTPEEVKEASLRAIKDGAEGGGYVLMPGCDIPPSVPLENIQAFINAAHEYKT
jgi:uroporphyrinogen decarboxylase